MAASVGLPMKPSFHSGTAAVLICTCGCLLLGASAIAAQVPSPAPRKPPPLGSTTQVMTAEERAKLSAAEQTALAFTLSPQEFAARAVKLGKIVKGPVVTVRRPVGSPFQLNRITSGNEEVKLTVFPSSDAKLWDGCDPGFLNFVPLRSTNGGAPSPLWGCPKLKSSFLATSPDYCKYGPGGCSEVPMFPGATAVVTRVSDSLVIKDFANSRKWSSLAIDSFSFKKLAPGFSVTKYQVESHDMSEQICPWSWVESGFSARVDAAEYSPVATWDDNAQALKVYLDGWQCDAFYTASYWDGPRYWGSVKVADYALTVWVTGPKSKGPWGGKIVTVR